jgi:hypothetical protein
MIQIGGCQSCLELDEQKNDAKFQPKEKK